MMICNNLFASVDTSFVKNAATSKLILTSLFLATQTVKESDLDYDIMGSWYLLF